MLKRLYLDKCFTHHNRTFTFDKGLTAITGPNESGKSLITEMIRYSLFGSAALRGKADDYKSLHTELDFSVKGFEYSVTRKAGKATLFQLPLNVQIATGTKPVNKKIIEILGYDLAVFDIAHACNQGKIEALADMLPSERREMIDQTVGLNTLDALNEDVALFAKTERVKADALRSVLVNPVEPERPFDYVTSESLAPAIVEAAEKERMFHMVSGRLASPAPTEPVFPTCDVTTDSATLRNDMKTVEQLRLMLSKASGELSATPDAEYTQEQIDQREEALDAYQASEQKKAFVKAGKVPTHDKATLEAMKADHAEIALFERHTSLNKSLQSLASVECDKCGHHQAIQKDQLARLQADLSALPPLRGDLPEKPSLSLVSIEKALINLELHGAEWDVLKDVPDAPYPGYGDDAIDKWTKALLYVGQRQSLVERVNDLKTQIEAFPSTLSKDYEKRVAYEAQQSSYEEKKQAYDTSILARRLDEQTYAGLNGAVEALSNLRERQNRCQNYESRHELYVTQKAKHEVQLSELAAIDAVAEEYDRARTAIKNLRARVKEYLVPSLSKVASDLISEMTNGQRTSILIDEEFEITVDSQPLNTLSGSGKAVANLAVRLGLGQVLTNRVFSLFMGDEVDAAMDQSRAESSAACFRSLTQSIEQIIIVSHKTPEADHYIKL
jgi:DNA repair protein SbcC/Rad50